jgi:4-amino-4-deoxy-L-arabinose transferase-like glycosyltransferase
MGMSTSPASFHRPFPGAGGESGSRAWRWVGIAALVGLAARLFRLDHQSLWVDEIFTWHNAEVGGQLSPADIFSTDHGPLLQVLLHFLGGWFGESEFLLRLPSALAGACTVPALAALAGRVLGGRALVPAAWLAALSPFLVWYGQEARNYPFAILFAILATWAAVRWKEEGGFAKGVLFTLATWFGVLSNLNVALIVPVLVLYLLWPMRGGRVKPVAVLASCLALAVLESPWIWDHVHRLDVQRLVPGRDELPGEAPLRGRTTFSWMGYAFTAYVFSVGYTLGPPLSALHAGPPLAAALAFWPVVVPAGILFALLGAAGVWGLRGHPRSLWLLLGLVAVPTLFVTYFALQNFKVFNPRYVSSGLAGYYLFLAAGWLTLRPRARWFTAAAVAALWAGSLLHLYYDPRYGREDFRGATAWLRQRIEPDDRLVATAGYSPLDYYWRGDEPAYRIYWLGYAHDEARMKEKFAVVEDTTQTTWVVISRPYVDDPEGRFERWLSRERGAVRSEFPGVRIYRLPAGGAKAERGTRGGIRQEKAG